MNPARGLRTAGIALAICLIAAPVTFLMTSINTLELPVSILGNNLGGIISDKRKGE